MTNHFEKIRKALAHEIWTASQLAPGEGAVDGVARVEVLLRNAAYPVIIQCVGCRCDRLDNGLNPVGCPCCKLSAETEASVGTMLAAQQPATELRRLHAESERDEALLRQALEALEFFRDTAICEADTAVATEAIAALRERLGEGAERGIP